jgi:hypothetical protein
MDIHEARLEKDWNRWLPVIQAQYARSGSVAATHPNATPARTRWYNPYGMSR